MGKRVALVILVAGLAGVGASVAWAVAGGGSAWAPGFGMGPGMMRGYGSTVDASPVPTIPAARAKAQAFADKLGLRTSEVMQFERNFHVKLVDAQGAAATEVLVDPATGFVSLEYGPAMMWNTKYGMASAKGYGTMMGGYAPNGRAYGPMTSPGVGMMGGGMMGGAISPGYGGMMGGSGRMGSVAPRQAPAGPVAIGEARRLAQTWLDANQPGAKVETGGDAFPGYFTFETLKDGKIVGMISVNETTGAVWPHWWHGAFVATAA